MKKNLQTAFITRQHMLSRDFELYYYNDHNLSKVDLHSHNYYEFYFFMEGDVSIQIGTEVYPIHFGDIMLVPPHIPHRPIIHSTASPYRRFVFWISQEYCNHLLQISKDYAYLMQHVQVSQNYFFPTDRITFNAIQSKLLRLIEEVRSDRFGRDAQIPLYVNDLLLYLNRLVYERLHPQKSRTEESLYQNVAAYIEEHLDEDLSLEKLAGEFFVSKYHIAHGVSNAILIAHVMEFNKDACTERLAALCDAVYPEKYAETADSKADYIISEIKDVVAKVHIPTKLDEFGVKKEDLDFLVKAGSQQTRLLVNNCKELSLDDIRYLYEKLF